MSVLFIQLGGKFRNMQFRLDLMTNNDQMRRYCKDIPNYDHFKVLN